MEHPITISTDEADLAATLHYPPAADGSRTERRPIIVICHGFVGSRIGVERLFVKAARDFAKAGFMVLRFDYGGCGESTGDYGAGGLDIMIEQTRRVIDYVLCMDYVDPSRFILLGHSLGGAVSVLTAEADKRIKTLVLWSPVGSPIKDISRIVGSRTLREAMEQGKSDYLGYELTKGFFDSLSRHDPLKPMNRFAGDVLVVHGSADDVIPVEYSSLYQGVLWQRTEGTCEVEVIPYADHTFSDRESYLRLVAKTRDWLLDLDRRKKDWDHWTI